MIHLTITVDDTAELLAPQAYGAGALLRWESSATQGGTYVEGGTVPLVSGTSLYDVWDSAGVTGTWYQTRISNTGGTVFSAHSAPFQSGAPGLLSVDQLREHIETTLTDPALQLLIDSAVMDIVSQCGPLGPLVDRRRGGGVYLFLSRTAASITSVVERWGDPLGLTDVVMDTTDYTLMPDMRTLRREWVGTHRNDRWAPDVIVTYPVLDDTANRARAVINLVKLEIAYQPGLTEQAIGDWSEQYRNVNYADERAQIFASLNASIPWFA